MKPPKRLFLRIFLLIAIAACGLGSNVAINERQYVLAGVAVAVGFVCAVIELLFVQTAAAPIKNGRLSDREFARLASPKTRDEVWQRLARLVASLGWDGTSTISITVHLAATRGDCSECHTSCSLVQLVGYLGKRRGGEGRSNSDLKGIIGRCLRTRAPQTVNFENDREYTRLMSKEFGYYINEVSFHDTDGRSYLCHPIGREGGAMAVLYIYSTEPHTFPDNAATYPQLPQLIAACSDIAHILEDDPLVLAAIS